MGVNPTTELKRRLEDPATPLPKRLCLAKNVASTQYLPVSSKERALVDWLDSAEICKDIVQSILTWQLDDAGNELLGKVIEVIATFLQNHPKETEIIESVIKFLENDSILSQLTTQTEHYLNIFTTLLCELKDNESNDKYNLCSRLFENIKKVYRKTIKKLNFVIRFIHSRNLEIVFHYLNDTELRNHSLNVCQTILFPQSKKSFYATFLQTIFRQETIDDMLEEKGDNLKAVIKIMSALFAFPKDRTEKNPQFIIDFINSFVSAFKENSNLVFLFFIVAVNSLKIQQAYLNPAMSMPGIVFEENDDKIKRNIILKALEVLKENEIDLNVKLTEILGEKVTRVEIKKNFLTFLQSTIMGVLKPEGKPDKNTLKIVTTSLKLDPNLIESKLETILPNIMASKKSNLKEEYKEMLNTLLETQFKLSRGTEFIPKVLPLLKTQLEAVNTEQFELRQQMLEDGDSERIRNKIITGEDLFPAHCIDKFGRLSSELMLKQNGELFVALQKEFETHCIILLEEGYVSPSLVILSEVLSSILASFMLHTKMADHTVPVHIASEFWTNFKVFEDEFLSKFGQCILNLNYNRYLTLAYLKLCSSYMNLKLINIRYGNTKLENAFETIAKSTGVMDMNAVLPCLDTENWLKLAKRVFDTKDFECTEILNSLLFQKIMACNLCLIEKSDTNVEEHKQKVKSHLVTEIDNLWALFDKYPYYAAVLFENIDQNMEVTIAKAIVKKVYNDDVDVIGNSAVANNKTLLNAITMETLKMALKVIEDEEFLKTNKSIRKALKAGFEFEEVVKGTDFVTVFENISKSASLDGEENQNEIQKILNVAKLVKIAILEENTQLLTVFILMSIKNILKNAKCKKLKKCVDEILLEIYEMTPKYPNIFKIFPIEYIFSFDNSFLALLTLNRLKTPNKWIIVKASLETAVKKVKTDPDIIKNLVNMLLSKKNKTMDFFTNDSNHIVCLILPIIAKEKKNITTSKHRIVLAELQEKLHKFLLKAFKKVDFTGNREVAEEDRQTALYALESYSLTLSKCCESNEESDNFDCLSSSLGYFIKCVLSAIEDPETKSQHLEASLQLLNTVFRYVKKLSTHDIFEKKDELYSLAWKAVQKRLEFVFCDGIRADLEEISVAVKFISELISIEAFTSIVCSDLAKYVMIKPAKEMIEDDKTLAPQKISQFATSAILKSNIIGPKSAAIAKIALSSLKDATDWLKKNFEEPDRFDVTSGVVEEKVLTVNDRICEFLSCFVESLNAVIMNAKKILLNWRMIDAVFILIQNLCRLLRNQVSNEGFLLITNGVVKCLNALLLHRQEMLEDRWPCYLQCYRSLVDNLSVRSSSSSVSDKIFEEKLSEAAHSVEKLTQALCKQKSQVTRLTAYLVADMSSILERNSPIRSVRLHFENCVVLLIQASENVYSSAFLRRALAGNAGHMTMTNLYTMYKRYHKYVGAS